MKKICLVAHLNDMSGANRALVDLARRLKKTNDIIVVIPRSGMLEDRLKKEKIKYKCIYSATWVYKQDEKFLKKIIKILANIVGEIQYYFFFKKEKIDLIHFNSITYGCGAIAAHLNKIPYIWHIRELAEENFKLKFFNKRRAYKLIAKSKQILTISNFMFSKIKDEFTKNNISIVYDGIECTDVICKENKKPTKLVLIGAIASDKGQLDALRAVCYLSERKGMVIELEFVGQVTDEIYYKKLKKSIPQKLKQYVNFIGYQKDVVKYRSNDYIALMCSKAEAFGLVTVEAMYAGQIVIGSSGGATPELIENLKSGFIYEYGNYRDLAEKIEMVFNMNIDDLSIIQNNAVQRVEKEFNIKRTVEKVQLIYRNILKDNL